MNILICLYNHSNAQWTLVQRIKSGEDHFSVIANKKYGKPLGELIGIKHDFFENNEK